MPCKDVEVKHTCTLCAEIIDDIVDHTDVTNTRLIRETRHIKVLDRKSGACCESLQTLVVFVCCVNPSERRGNDSGTSDDMKLVHWPLMGGLLYLVQRGGDWVGLQPTQASPPVGHI